MLSNTQKNWEKHINAWEKSGLSQKAYCRQEKISFSAFYYWRKKLTLNTPRFVELKFRQTNDSHSPITITLLNGIRIDVNINPEPEIIKEIVSSLKDIV